MQLAARFFLVFVIRGQHHRMRARCESVTGMEQGEIMSGSNIPRFPKNTINKGSVEVLPEKPKSKHTGRRPKITPEVTEVIAKYVELGNYDYVAAQAAGIDPITFIRWMNKGEDKVDEEGNIIEMAPEPYRKFRQIIKDAEAKSEVTSVMYVRAQMPENWTAAMTHLERKHPERWGRRDKVTTELSGPNGGPIPLMVKRELLEKLTIEDLNQLESIALRLAGNADGDPG